jgi:hypothetical protein
LIWIGLVKIHFEIPKFFPIFNADDARPLYCKFTLKVFVSLLVSASAASKKRSSPVSLGINNSVSILNQS